MEELKKDTVRMKDPENVKNLISQIIAGGKDQLQVIDNNFYGFRKHLLNVIIMYISCYVMILFLFW